MAVAWKQKSIFLDARCTLALLVSVLYVSTASSPVALAQDAIRVETNQVIVPVIVVDKERFRQVRKDGSLFRAVLPGEADAIVSGVLILDLSAADFQILDDGRVQPIQNVTEERGFYWDVRDNRGHHTEYIGPGGGKWSTAEWPQGFIGDIDAPQHYLVAYNVPKSPEGSCHHVKIKVNRRNVLVAARSEYCNTKHFASDPLNGTRLGTQMENDLVLAKENKVAISILAITLHSDGNASRVHIALDWPAKSLNGESRTKGVLGMIFKKDGRLVTRFSDLADREGVPYRQLRVHSDRPGVVLVEDRYETQLPLPAGEYELGVVVSDGTRFGRAELPLTVEAFDRQDLAISTVSLCKQIDDASAYGQGSILPGAWTAKLPGNYVPLVSKEVEFKPTGDTRFKKGATLYTYFEVFEPLLGDQSPPAVKIQIRIVDLRTGELRSDSQPIDATSYVKAGSPVIPIGRGIDISSLPLGSYRLDVRATDSIGQSTVWRSANFTVE